MGLTEDEETRLKSLRVLSILLFTISVIYAIGFSSGFFEIGLSPITRNFAFSLIFASGCLSCLWLGSLIEKIESKRWYD